MLNTARLMFCASALVLVNCISVVLAQDPGIDREIENQSQRLSRAIADRDSMLADENGGTLKGMNIVAQDALIRELRSNIAELRATKVIDRMPQPTQVPVEENLSTEFRKLQGVWRSEFMEFRFTGKDVYVPVDYPVFARAKVHLDPDKHHIDFELPDGTVVKQIYRWKSIDGTEVLEIQRGIYPHLRPSGFSLSFELVDQLEQQTFRRAVAVP